MALSIAALPARWYRANVSDVQTVGVFDNRHGQSYPVRMRAKRLLHERHLLSAIAFVDIKIWWVPQSVRRSTHVFKYSLALVVSGECVMRYDNEAGKGDHKHFGLSETAYNFVSPAKLLEDFWADVNRWRSQQ